MNPARLRLASTLRHPAILALIGFAWLLAGVGCGTLGGSGADSYASVTIRNHTPEEIIAATAQVFGADGYRGAMSGPGQMVFEKSASALTTLSRDGLMATQAGGRTIKRVRVEIVSVADDAYRLQCKAYLVTGGSDPFFQNEAPVSKARSGAYHALLQKVADQLP